MYSIDDLHKLPVIYRGERIVNTKGQISIPMEYIRLHHLRPGDKLVWFYLDDEIIIQCSQDDTEEEDDQDKNNSGAEELRILNGAGRISSENNLFTLKYPLRKKARIYPNMSVLVIANEECIFVKRVTAQFTAKEYIDYGDIFEAEETELEWDDLNIYQKEGYLSENQMTSMELNTKYVLSHPECIRPQMFMIFEKQNKTLFYRKVEKEELRYKWEVVICNGIPEESTDEGLAEFVRNSYDKRIYHKRSYFKMCLMLFYVIGARMDGGEEYLHLGKNSLFKDCLKRVD